MEVSQPGTSNLVLDVPYKNLGKTIARAQEYIEEFDGYESIPDEISDLATAEFELSVAGMKLEKGLRRPEQRDAFEERLMEYRGHLEAKLQQDIDCVDYDHQEDCIRAEIIDSVSRVLEGEMAIRRMASGYERKKAFIAETRLRRTMGSIAIGTGVGAGLYWGIDTFGGAAATGGVLTFFATRGHAVANIAKSVVVSATRTASKQVSHQGAQISQGIISEHVPGEYNSIPMPSGVAGTLTEIENAVSVRLIGRDKSSRMEHALDATMEIIESKYCPAPLKDMIPLRKPKTD